MIPRRSTILFTLSLLLMSGCAIHTRFSEDPHLISMLPARQTRELATADKEKVLRGSIATLQDLDFSIDKVDVQRGMIWATKFSRFPITIDVAIDKTSSAAKVLVGAQARYDNDPIRERAFYQAFFSQLAHSVPAAATIPMGSQQPARNMRK